MRCNLLPWIVFALLGTAPSCVMAIGNRPNTKEGATAQDAGGEEEAAPDAAGDGGDAADEDSDDLARDLDAARQKLEVAHIETQQQQMEAAQDQREAEQGLAKAQAELDHFRSDEMPRQLRAAELDLQEGRDHVKETEEELAQLQMMYKDDLADATAEIVLARTQRRLEMARAQLQVQEQGLAALRDFQLPWEQKEHEMAVESARVKLDSARLAQQSLQIERRLAEQDAQKDVADLEKKSAKQHEDKP